MGWKSLLLSNINGKQQMCINLKLQRWSRLILKDKGKVIKFIQKMMKVLKFTNTKFKIVNNVFIFILNLQMYI